MCDTVRRLFYKLYIFLQFVFVFDSVNDDTEMLSPGWTEVFVDALQVTVACYNV